MDKGGQLTEAAWTSTGVQQTHPPTHPRVPGCSGTRRKGLCRYKLFITKIVNAGCKQQTVFTEETHKNLRQQTMLFSTVINDLEKETAAGWWGLLPVHTPRS